VRFHGMRIVSLTRGICISISFKNLGRV